MSLSAPFIHRPVATVLLTAAIALAGAVAFTVLPVSPLPQIDFPPLRWQRLSGSKSRDHGFRRSRHRWSGSSGGSPA